MITNNIEGIIRKDKGRSLKGMSNVGLFDIRYSYIHPVSNKYMEFKTKLIGIGRDDVVSFLSHSIKSHINIQEYTNLSENINGLTQDCLQQIIRENKDFVKNYIKSLEEIEDKRKLKRFSKRTVK